MDVRENVLLVEDDPALSELVGGVLDQAGYRAVTIADHELISSAVERWQPRCVILDGELPWTGEGRSWADAAALHRAHPDMPVLMFTADAAAVAEARAGSSDRSRAAGFAGILGKPFAVDDLLATVRSAVEHTPPAPETLTGDWPPADLFATIVHGLRAPLTAMRGHAQLARRFVGQDPARERAAIDTAIAQMDRMADMISQLLNETRLSSNAPSLDLAQVDLFPVVAEVIARHDYAEGRRIRLQSALASAFVYSDAERTAEILDTLVDNALKYSDAASPIDISFRVRGGEVVIRVTDRGVGVPRDEHAQLFGPFYRTSRTAKIRGTGLGLYIARRQATRLGGRLWLESSSEAGSVFALALPMPPLDGSPTN